MFFCCFRMYFWVDACLSVIKVLIIRPHPSRYCIQFVNLRNSIAGLLPATFLYKNKRTHSCSSLFKQNSWGKCMCYRSNINFGYIFDTSWFFFPLSLFIIIWTICTLWRKIKIKLKPQQSKPLECDMLYPQEISNFKLLLAERVSITITIAPYLPEQERSE